MRSLQRILTGTFMVVLLTTLFVATACGKGQEIVKSAGAAPTEVVVTTTEAPATTTTTMDPAALDAFLKAWQESETTTTTAPPPPPPTTAKPKPVPTTARPVPVTQAPEPQEPQEVPEPQEAPTSYGSGACGGDLPPCYVMMRESGGNITAQNPSSTASGKWQFLDSTWQGYGGYAKARYAPESVQDAKARLLWAGGRGCSHWSAC